MNHKITHICENIYDVKWIYGVIAGVYKNCFNILTDDDVLLTVFRKNHRFSTRAMITDADFDEVIGIIDNGMRVINFNGIINVGNLTFDTRDALKISTKRDRIEACEDIDKSICQFKKVLEEYGKQSPVCNDELISKKFSEGFERLCKNPSDGFKSMIGLGIGLTPSCDDVLSGISAWLYLNGVGEEFNKQLSEYLVDKGNVVTTTVSKNLLYDVANGYINESVYDLIYSIMADADKIKDCTLKMIEYGSTSGTETCIGISKGYEIIKNKELTQWL